MNIVVHTNDLSSNVDFGQSVAIDTEAMGLTVRRDRLCLVQLTGPDGICHLVHFPEGSTYKAPNLKKVLQNKKILKIFHFARFDMAALKTYLNVDIGPVYCTKIASKIGRTYTGQHSLKDLCTSLLGIELAKQEQTSDWGQAVLTENQKRYAATDVVHLHALKEKLDAILKREGRTDLAQACFDFLPTCVDLDIQGWDVGNLFAHT